VRFFILPLSRVCQRMSSMKRNPLQNKLVRLESALLANPQQNFGRSSAQFAGIVRSRSWLRVETLCEASRGVGRGAELSGQGKRNDEDASEASRATLFFFIF